MKGAMLLAAAAAALVLALPAGAATYQVAGKQSSTSSAPSAAISA